jgi:hypothetical protein
MGPCRVAGLKLGRCLLTHTLQARGSCARPRHAPAPAHARPPAHPTPPPTQPRYNLSIGIGLSKVNGKVFRIGHLGNMDELMMCSALSGAEMAMIDSGLKVKPGVGVGRGEARRRGPWGFCEGRGILRSAGPWPRCPAPLVLLKPPSNRPRGCISISPPPSSPLPAIEYWQKTSKVIPTREF